MKKLFFVMAVSFVGIANATVWNPAANWIFPPDAGDWGNAANWTDGVPMADSGAAFVVPGAADCHVTTPDAVCGVLLQGDNGPGGVLRIMDGGSLTTGSNWSAVGYNDTARLIVEAGGTVNFDDHLYVALNHGAVGALDLEGGTVNVGGMFGLGWNGGDGYANINDGRKVSPMKSKKSR